MLAGAGGDLIGRGHAQLSPRLFGQGLDRRPPVPEDESDGLGGNVHRRRLRFVRVCNAADDLGVSKHKQMGLKKTARNVNYWYVVTLELSTWLDRCHPYGAIPNTVEI